MNSMYPMNDDASQRAPSPPDRRHPERRRPPHPGAPLRRARQGRVRAAAARPRARRSSSTTARSSRWTEALRRHPHDPDDPNHTFYFHIDDEHVIDAEVRRQCGALDQPRLRAQLRGRRGRRPRLHQGAARHRAGRGTVLRLRPHHRRALHAEAEEAVRLPLRRQELPRHHARARSDDADACLDDDRATAGAAWRAEALWQQLEPLLPGLSVEVRRAPIPPTPCCSSARAAVGRRRRAGHHARRSRCAPRSAELLAAPFGRRAGDTQPCLLVAEHQTRGRGRQGRAWQCQRRARR